MSTAVIIFYVFHKIGHNICINSADKQKTAAFYRRNNKKISKKVLQITAK